MTTFDYKEALQAGSISYVANRVFGVNAKFVDDPEFSLVFINDEVAIFKVGANINLDRRRTSPLMGKLTRERQLEVAFITIFSGLFYSSSTL